MPSVSREKLIEVCSQLSGKELKIVPHKKHSVLVPEKWSGADREVLARQSKIHGSNNEVNLSQAYRILRRVVVDEELVEAGKRKLRT